MSKVDPNLVEFEKEYEYFDEQLNLKKNKVKVSYTEIKPVFPDNVTEEQKQALITEANNKALEALNASGEWQDAANYVIRRKALAEAKTKAGASGGINRAILMETIKPYRENPQFSGMIKNPDKRKATAEEWEAQTAAICAQIKDIPFIMDSIKARSAAVTDED